MKLRNIIIICLFCLVPTLSQAVSKSNVYVKELRNRSTSSGQQIIVSFMDASSNLVNFNGDAGCVDCNWVIFPSDNSEVSKYLRAQVLAAYTNKSPLTIETTGTAAYHAVIANFYMQ
jgi:hypothetical protein